MLFDQNLVVIEHDIPPLPNARNALFIGHGRSELCVHDLERQCYVNCVDLSIRDRNQ